MQMTKRRRRVLAVQLKPGKESHWKHIHRVRWIKDGSPRIHDETRREVIARLDRGEVFYTVGRDGRDAIVRPVPLGGKRYIRTSPDDSTSDNLLAFVEVWSTTA